MNAEESEEDELDEHMRSSQFNENEDEDENNEEEPNQH
jgi:hypothetical protein